MNTDTKQDILKRIDNTIAEDFDGHTDFQRLPAKQKLQWLSNTAYFVYTVGKNNPGLGCSRFIRQ